jgi:nucleotide-binding universal stress UspA family protein
MLHHKEEDMAAMPIIAGTDGSEESLRAVEWAAREAALHGSPLRIVAVPALPPLMSWQEPAARPDTVADVVHKAYLRALATSAERAAEVEPGLAVETRLLSGPPAQALLESAAAASMLVVGSRGAGAFSAMVLGSMSRDVAAHAPCPVVVAREETMAAHREIVVGVRDFERADAVLGFAFAEAALRKARILVVHAWFFRPPVPLGALTAEEQAVLDPRLASAGATARLDGMLAPWRENYPGLQASAEVVHAHPARVLAGMSARADLVVLGRHSARSGDSGRVGSVAHGVLHHAHGPVAIIPAE